MKKQNPFASSQGVKTITPELNSRREMLEASKLSRLPSLPRRTPPIVAVPTDKPAVLCVNCKTQLTEENQKVKSANVCAECVSVFAVVSTEFDRAADRKSRDARLKKFGGKI